MRVTVLGTGLMGSGLAACLLRAGHEVVVWNRDGSRAEALRDAGAVPEADVATAVREADAVITTLFDADSVLEVAERAELPSTAVWLQASTIGTDGARRVADLAEARGVPVLEVQLMGGKKLADDGTLVLLVAGPPEHVDTVRPVLDAIGRKTIHVGPEVGQASALKLVCNAWITSLTAAVAQSVALARAFGLDPDLFFQAIDGGQSDTPYARIKGGQMVSGAYSTSFKLDAGLKDVRLARAAADGLPVETALLDALAALYERASAAGRGSDDLAAVFAAFEAPPAGGAPTMGGSER